MCGWYSNFVEIKMTRTGATETQWWDTKQRKFMFICLFSLYFYRYYFTSIFLMTDRNKNKYYIFQWKTREKTNQQSSEMTTKIIIWSAINLHAANLECNNTKWTWWSLLEDQIRSNSQSNTKLTISHWWGRLWNLNTDGIKKPKTRCLE